MSGILSVLAGIKTAIATAVDEYFNRVTLLLPGNGTNGAQNNTFLDSSSNNFSITRNGNTTQGTFSPFSQTGWSTYINANGNYFTSGTSSALGFGTGDFTIEFFVYIVGFTDNQFLVDFRPSGSGGATKPWIYLNTSGTLIYGTSGATQISGGTVTGNAWHHIAVSRASGSTKMFLNGAQVGSTYTDSNNYGTSERFVVGTFGDAPGNSNANGGTVIGYMSNLRILKGTGLYTGSYTVPTAALTSITNTSVLTFQSNRWVDNSTNAIAITPSGTPSVQAFSPFAPTAAYSAATNGGSGYFDGTGDYLSVPNNAVYDLSGATSWCIETWAYWNSVAGEQNLVEKFTNPSGPGWTLYKFSSSNGTPAGSIDFYGGSAFNSGVVPVAGQWYHIVICRDNASGRTSWFINGTRTATTTTFSIGGNAATPLVVGVRAGGSTYFNGSMSGMSVVKGSSVYDPSQTSITVPTSPPTAITNTSLLLNFTNAGITDATAKNDLETVGNAQISTTQSKFGGSSIAFDGDDTVTMPARQVLALGSGNWTIECWVRLNATGTETTIGGSKNYYTAGFNGNFVFRVGTTNLWRSFDGQASQATIDGTYSWSTGVWYHVAWVRNGSTVTCYRDGTSLGSTTDTKTLNDSANGIVLGSSLNAYVDDLRITVGQARYTTTFTPPTAAFPLS